jgi:hypothetical protein
MIQCSLGINDTFKRMSFSFGALAESKAGEGARRADEVENDLRMKRINNVSNQNT